MVMSRPKVSNNSTLQHFLEEKQLIFPKKVEKRNMKNLQLSGLKMIKHDLIYLQWTHTWHYLEKSPGHAIMLFVRYRTPTKAP